MEIILNEVLSNPLSSTQWRFRIQKLLSLCQKQIVFVSTLSIAIPMRIIEIFTSFDLIRQRTLPSIENKEIIQFTKSVFSYMIDQNYYKNVRIMLNDKISDTTYDEVTTRPKTEISKVILEMIWRPLQIVSEFTDESFNAKILSTFTQEILVRDPNYTITNFIIPSLAIIKDFPYVKLISFLYDVYSSETFYISSFGDKNSNLKFNGFLLNAILQFDINFLDSVINHQCLHKYLIIVGSMINCITMLPKPKENTTFSYVDDSEESQSEDDSDNEDDSPDDEMQSQFERLILLDIIKQLNEEQRVNKIVKNVDSILHLPQVIQSICIIAHNLLIYNRSAIHDYRLLDLLAFKPNFIRTLWYTLLTSKSEKNHLYISILSKGIIIRKLYLNT